MAWVEIAISYLLLKFIKRKYVGIVTTIFCLVYLAFVHVERMLSDYGGWYLGVSTSIMVLCIHLSGVAWDYADGEADPATLSSEQKKNALHEIPNFMEYFASAVSPTQSFAGPISNFADFRDYVRMEGIYKSIPSTIVPGMKRLANGIILIISFVGLTTFFSISNMALPSFQERNFFYKVAIFLIDSIFI